jgi:hypothetical protein
LLDSNAADKDVDADASARADTPVDDAAEAGTSATVTLRGTQRAVPSQVASMDLRSEQVEEDEATMLGTVHKSLQECRTNIVRCRKVQIAHERTESSERSGY